jgi:LytS/YehU family sensor histidine kinase
MPATLATSYFVTDFLIPKFLLTKRYKIFVLYSCYTIIVSAYLIIVSFTLSFVYIADLQMTNMSPLSKDAFFVIIGVFLVVISSSVVRLLKYNYATLSSHQALKEKMLETELKSKIQELQFLKNQINPHFLFNTLNTLYGLALKKSEQTPETIIQLSNLLDYILYHSDNQLVPLQKEISHIHDYIALEKTRFRDKLSIAIEVEGDTDLLMIPPMIIIPFVENCFKHGQVIAGKLQIQIQLKVEASKFTLEIQNSKKSSTHKSEKGIGIKNTERRLQLLYGDTYNLHIADQRNAYKVSLQIDTDKISRPTNEQNH